jgi:hypothetical protein
MGWAWLIMLLATYPWLLGADLASDVLARGGFVVFISGVCIVAPCRRLRPIQAIPFAACVGFLFEARRPIPDGVLAFTLVAISIFLTANKPLLRNAPGLLRGAIISNTLACTAWAAATALVLSTTEAPSSNSTLTHFALQVALAALIGAALYIPISLVQNYAMDRIGVPPAADTP